jgi:acyl-homoserine-lactone acylase
MTNRWFGSRSLPRWCWRWLCAALTAGVVAGGASGADTARAEAPWGRGVVVRWDHYGVAHVEAPDLEGLFFGYGFAQMVSHGDLVLKLYGESRGRAAEYWGETYLENDRWVWRNDVPARAQLWFAAQSPAMQRQLTAFAAGMNAAVARHPSAVSDERRRALPVQPVDALQHVHRIVQFAYLSSAARIDAAVEGPAPALGGIGSNAWAIAPARSAGGHSLLLMNPHLPWRDWYTYYEIHLVAPGINLYGASQIGFPMLRFAFTDRHGFTHTVNNLDGSDLYRIDIASDGAGYLLDGVVQPFTTVVHRLRVRQPDDTWREELMTVPHTVHGPVVWDRDGLTLAQRTVSLNRPFAIEQYWGMALAPDFAAFEAELQRLQVPTFNIVYADREGNILYLFNGTLPRRSHGDHAHWSGLLPGNTAATLWQEVHDYAQLPRLLNPAGGWVQNSNDPPWTAHWPPPAELSPAAFPPYTAGTSYTLRTARSLRWLALEQPPPAAWTFEKLQEAQHDTHLELADRVLPALAAAVEAHGTDRARRAIDVLAAWDRRADADSRGAPLFIAWAERFAGPAFARRDGFAVPFDPLRPFDTPAGVQHPEQAAAWLDDAAQEIEARHTALDVAFGEAFRLRRDSVDLPARGAPGGLGSFHVVNYGPPGADGRRAANFGESFTAIVEFSDPVRAEVRLSYGNSSRPGSPHASDQLSLLASGELRPALRTPSEIEAATVRVDRF